MGSRYNTPTKETPEGHYDHIHPPSHFSTSCRFYYGNTLVALDTAVTLIQWVLNLGAIISSAGRRNSLDTT